MNILEKLGIFGWKRQDENIMFASMLTGEPLLMLAEHGTSKTGAAALFAKSLGFKYHAYDASKDLFDDVVGFVDIEALKNGKVKYIESEVTIFDKEFALIDEINRTKKEMQSKWLEILRSRTIMGMATKLNWVWAACNPLNYTGTNAMDEALIGRFAYFLYPPTVSQMTKNDRIKIASNISVSDLPGIGYWSETTDSKLDIDFEKVGNIMKGIISRAAKHFDALREEMPEIPRLVSDFGKLVLDSSKGRINLDGRRLGYITRAIFAVRAIEIARSEISKDEISSLKDCIKYTLYATIPTSINDDTVNTEEDMHIIDQTIEMMSKYIRDRIDNNGIDKIYRLFTSQHIDEIASLLLCEDLPDMAKRRAWETLLSNQDQNTSLLAIIAAHIEVEYPNTLPAGIGGEFRKVINPDKFLYSSLPRLTGKYIKDANDIKRLMEFPNTKMEKYIMVHILEKYMNRDQFSYDTILEEFKTAIVGIKKVIDRFLSEAA